MTKESQPTIVSSFMKSKEKNLSSFKKYLATLAEQYGHKDEGISQWILQDDDDKVLSRGLVFLKSDEQETEGKKKKRAYHRVKYQGGKIFVNGNEVTDKTDMVYDVMNDLYASE